MNKLRIKSIDILSAAKMYAVMGAVIGLIIGVIYGLFTILFGAMMMGVGTERKYGGGRRKHRGRFDYDGRFSDHLCHLRIYQRRDRCADL